MVKGCGSGFATAALWLGYAHLVLLCLGLVLLGALWAHFLAPIFQGLSTTS